jgi:AraC family transcriptional regulator of adaptative response/methylated-DNA-[protein]-cysteine methyltransferase
MSVALSSPASLPSTPRSTALPTDARAWRAVRERDARFDGRFVFAVATTGVYCLPSCRSRAPRRENVRFFAGPVEAERAGFRACRRCRPDRPASERGPRLALAVRRYLDERPTERPTLRAIADAVSSSPSHVARAFRKAYGVTPAGLVAARRAESMRARLREGDRVLDAAFESGYGAASRAYAGAARTLGMPPGAFRRGAPGERIRVSVAPCALGRVLVAATERGVCAVALGARSDALRADLRREFPHARFEPAGAALRRAVRSVLDAIEGRASDPGTLDLRGSDFERRVWEALRRIPAGATRTYAEVARALGRPRAARAVARACARNRIALLVPCHRVVPAAGGSGGYRWGTARKTALIEAESKASRGRR